MPGSVREGINPSPTLDPLNPVFGYFRIKDKSMKKKIAVFLTAGFGILVMFSGCLSS